MHRDTPQFRPSLHFTPERNWMNDPNGLVLHKGTYHLFFQHNPQGRTWGNIGWGHATSTDLLTWHELPVAIPATDTEMAFSGSVVWDRDNTSGLGAGSEGPLVAFFTSAYPAGNPTRPGQQAQSIAYSLDDGATWARHAGNPVLERGSENFRDPKVFRHEQSGRWVMATVEAAGRQVLFHSSENLLDWRFESAFGPVGEEGVLWECPDLVELPVDGGGTRWVLVLSTNPGGFSGGSGMRYFVGSFDGHQFVADGDPRWLDYGPDFYAAVSFHGAGSTFIGWMSNWAYANQTPTFPWQSAMSVPRRLSLTPVGDGLVVRQEPVLPEVMPEGVTRAAIELSAGEEVVLVTGNGDAPSRCVIRRLEDGSLVVDRSEADPHGVHRAIVATPPIPLPDGPATGWLIEDHGLIELFLAEGTVAVTMQTFPHAGPVRVVTEPDAVAAAG
ncbi:glycoside hydrolase family 32 protein [Tessaracoccus lubricantis]|uniref:Glycoside hydrolase family 32 protein n=1 Tax=Tessaracoccus lubricantis TaxID=545543 RepID=A0ABP9EZX0_9ACTN